MDGPNLIHKRQSTDTSVFKSNIVNLNILIKRQFLDVSESIPNKICFFQQADP